MFITSLFYCFYCALNTERVEHNFIFYVMHKSDNKRIYLISSYRRGEILLQKSSVQTTHKHIHPKKSFTGCTLQPRHTDAHVFLPFFYTLPPHHQSAPDVWGQRKLGRIQSVSFSSESKWNTTCVSAFIRAPASASPRASQRAPLMASQDGEPPGWSREKDSSLTDGLHKDQKMTCKM